MFCKLWTGIFNEWTSPQKVWNAARKCGFTREGLDRNQVDRSKFAMAAVARGKHSVFSKMATPRAIVTSKFADLVSPDATKLIETQTISKTMEEKDAEILRLHQCLGECLNQTASLKALGFWDEPVNDNENEDESDKRVNIKQLYGDTLNCGIQEAKEVTKQKEKEQLEKSKLYHERVALNKEKERERLEKQAFHSNDYDAVSKRLGPLYKKLCKRAACRHILKRSSN